MPLAFGDKLIVDAGIRKEQEPFLPVVSVLGRKVAFKGNTSWRFGPMPQVMTSRKINLFKELRNFEYLDKSNTQVEFIGIKGAANNIR